MKRLLNLEALLTNRVGNNTKKFFESSNELRNIIHKNQSLKDAILELKEELKR